MRVCIDARCLGFTAPGLGHYAENLIRALAAIDPDDEYVVLLNRSFPGGIARQENVLEIRTTGRPDSVGNLLLGARKLARHDADVFHILHHFVPAGVPGRAIITLHDAVWPDLPGSAPGRHPVAQAERLKARLFMEYSLLRADHVISVSRSAALRAEHVMGVAPSRITVIPSGADERYRLAGELPSFRSTERPYLVMVDQPGQYDIVSRVIAAISLLGDRVRDIELRIYGSNTGNPRLRGLAEGYGIGDRVKFLASTDEDSLVVEIRDAIAMVFPSHIAGGERIRARRVGAGMPGDRERPGYRGGDRRRGGPPRRPVR